MSNRKEPWEKKVGNIINKIFNAFRGLLGILKKIVQQAMRTVITFFTYILDILTDPSSPCFFAMAALVLVGLVTSYQWVEIGLWFGRLVGMSQIMGWGFATVALIAGLGINVQQLSPELHKINVNLARSYQKIGLNPEHDGDPSNLGERIRNWHSFDFKIAKKGRIVSYVIETGIVALVLLATGINPVSFIIALVSLIAPEATVKWVKATTNTLDAINESHLPDDDDEVQASPRGSKGGSGFDSMPMGKPGRD